MNRLISIVLLLAGLSSLIYGVTMTVLERDSDENLLVLGLGAVSLLLSAAVHAAPKSVS